MAEADIGTAANIEEREFGAALSSSEVPKGSGFGELIGAEEGLRRLEDYVTKGPIEDWAGAVGESDTLDIEGISRSDLRD